MEIGAQTLNGQQVERLNELMNTAVNRWPQELQDFVKERMNGNLWASSGKELIRLTNIISYWVIYFDPERKKITKQN